MQRASEKPREFRLVRYYSQWPQGNDHEVIADHLTREEAEKMKREQSIGLKDEQLVVEDMEDEFPSGLS